MKPIFKKICPGIKDLSVIALFALFTISLSAQESYLRHYSTSDGLPSTETYSVFQDSKGYIWIASDMGVSKFNGYNFKVFTTADGLTDNTVFRFYEDPKGRIWFLTFSGRLCYYFNDSIYGKSFSVNQKIRDFLGSNYLTGIGGWNNDTLLVSSSNGLMKLIPGFENNAESWPYIEILSNKKTYLIKGGFVTSEPDLNHHTLISIYKQNQPPRKVLVPLLFVNFGSISESSANSFLVLFSEATYIVINENIIGWTESINHAVWGSFESDSTFWIGTRNKGCRLFSARDFNKPQKKLLESFTVSSILKDNEAGYWFTTLEKGVFYLPSDKFQHFTKANHEMPEGKIFLAARDSLSIWLVTENIIMSCAKKNGITNQFPGLLDYMRINEAVYFWNVFRASNNEDWISTSAGVTIVDSKSSRLKLFLDLAKLPSNIEFDSRKIIEDKHGKIWSLNLSTLKRFDLSTKKIEEVIPIPARAQALCEGNDGEIMVGTVNGLYCLRNHSLYYLGNENDIFKNRFVDIVRYKDNIIGATRGAGIVIISADTVIQISTVNGLLSNMCRSLFVDASATIWVATNKGLNSVKLFPAKKTITTNSFTVSDGLPSDDIEQVIKSDNLVWIVTQEGVTAFNPDSVLSNKVAPPVFITKITVDQKALPLHPHNEFSYTSNFIDINFNGLTYKNAGRQDYKYKLEGLNDAWTFTKNPFVQFTKLPPGNYKFIVSCINGAGIESSVPATLEFKILAPFYKKWWFGLLVMFFAILLIVLLATLIILRIRKQEGIKTEINKKIANLELDALRAQMNPHFIFNCLNAIQDFILKNDSESAKHYLSSFSKLIRRTLNNARKQNIPLIQEVDFLNLYLELERMRFNDKFDYQISVEGSIDAEETEVPSMILQPFVENAVRHGKIGSMAMQGILNINFSMRDNELVCIIEDNGIGLNESVRMKIGSEQQGQAHALDIMKERIQTYNEVNSLKIRYKISDKSDFEPGAKGTKIEFFLPINVTVN